MRARLAFIGILCSACAAVDSLTTTDGPFVLSLAQAAVARSGTVRATLTNQSREPVVRVIDSGCGNPNGPYQQQVAGAWVDRIGQDTPSCAGFSYADTLQPGANRSFSWLAPADTGTYRLTMAIGSYQLISTPFTVR